MLAIRIEVAERAAAVGGVFTRALLAQWGIDPLVVRTMRRRGLWIRVHHGVYADRETVDASLATAAAHARLVAAASLAGLDGPAAVIGVTAAELHGLPLPRSEPSSVEIWRPAASDHRALSGRLSVDGYTPRFISRDLDAPVVSVHGISTVAVADAAFTAACRVEPAWDTAILDAALWSGIERTALNAAAQRWRTVRGAAAATRALDHARPGAQTPLESISRVRLVAAGLPEPRLQVPLHDDVGLIGIVDMLFDDLGVVGEADGLLKYQERSALVSEKVREDRLRRLGYGVARWTWSEIWAAPRAVARRIVDAQPQHRPSQRLGETARNRG